MPATPRASHQTRPMNVPAEGTIITALRKLPPDYRADVLRYIEFLDYKINSERSDASEETVLWAAVEANREYKRLHPDEDMEVYETGADFFEACKDL